MPLSNDVLFGLLRGISDYDELCADKTLKRRRFPPIIKIEKGEVLKCTQN